MATERDFSFFGLTNPPNGDSPDPKQMLMWLCDVQWVMLRKIWERDKTGCHFGRVFLDTVERTAVSRKEWTAAFKTGFIACLVLIGALAGLGAQKVITLLHSLI